MGRIFASIVCLSIFLMAFAPVSSAVAFDLLPSDDTKIPIEKAREIALKRVPGTVEEEFAIEDEDGKVTDYIFYIKDKKDKTWEVQIGADKGEVVNAEMVDDEDDSDEPPAEEDPPSPSVRFGG